jgi:hypothetical protein
MSSSRQITLSVLLLLCGVTFSNAQSGSGGIEGTVTDAATGENLIGVNVTIEGTSIGSATDLDGDYVIRRVPSGSQMVVFSYIGYETSTVTVDVQPGERVEVNMTLVEERITGEEITISAQRQGQQQAINQQITSDHIVNVVPRRDYRSCPISMQRRPSVVFPVSQRKKAPAKTIRWSFAACRPNTIRSRWKGSDCQLQGAPRSGFLPIRIRGIQR